MDSDQRRDDQVSLIKRGSSHALEECDRSPETVRYGVRDIFLKPSSIELFPELRERIRRFITQRKEDQA